MSVFLFFCIVISLTFYFGSPPWESFHKEAFAFVFAAFSLFYILAYKKKIFIRISPLILFWFFFVVAISLQFLTGRVKFLGDFLVVLLYLLLCLSCIIFAQNSCSAKTIAVVAVSILFASLISSFIAIIQSLDIYHGYNLVASYNNYRRPGANIGQPNNLATLIIFGVYSLVYISNYLKWSVWTKLVILMVFSIGLAITESRTGLLNYLVFCALYFSLKNRISNEKINAIHFSIYFTFTLFLFFTWPNISENINNPGFAVDSFLINKTSSMRIEGWWQIINASLLKPFFGWGIRNNLEAIISVHDNFDRSLPFTYAHNFILDMALGFGIPVALIITLSIVILLKNRLINCKNIEAWYSLGVILLFVIHSLLEYPFAYAYFLLPFFLVVASEEKLIFLKLEVSKFIFLIFSIFTLFIYIKLVDEYIYFEKKFQAMRFESLGFVSKMEDVKYEILFLTQLEYLIKSLEIIPREKMSAEEIDILREVSLRFAFRNSHKKYISALILNKFYVEAMEQIKIYEKLYNVAYYDLLN